MQDEANRDRMKHHRYGPSTWPTLMTMCACYEGNGITNEWMEEGTRTHKLLEKSLSGDNTALLNEDQEVVDSVTYAHQEMMKRVDGRKFHSEIKLSGTLGSLGEFFGTADFVCGNTIFDYKNGRVFNPNYEYQMAGYAKCIFDSDPMADEVATYVVYGKLGKCYKYSFTRERAEKIARDLEERILESVASPCKYCTSCRKFDRCPAIQDEMRKHIDSSLVSFRGVVDPRDLSEILKTIEIVQGWCKSAKDYVESLRDVTPEGYEWVEKKGRETIDAKVAFQVIGCDPYKFIEQCSISKKDLFDLFKKERNLSQQKAAKELSVAGALLQGEVKTKLEKLE